MFLTNKDSTNKVILENGGMLMFIPDCYKDKKIVIMLFVITLMH